ncbi:MAG TPA: heavy metal-binding domain-containing protein [Pseudolabrys sp.]
MNVKSGGRVYTCPMHPRVSQSSPGRCPECDMPLLPEGTRFALLRHMMASPAYLAVLGVVLAALALTMVSLLR